MDKVIVFDVNETLLDLAPVREWFDMRFASDPDAGRWFSELLRLSFVSAATDVYVPFTELAAAALSSVAERSGVSTTALDVETIGGIFTTLPAHADVPNGLDILKRAGFTTAALTNSPSATAQAQLTNAGIASRFDHIMSVEMVHRFKPHASVYREAANRLAIPVLDLVMVAAHDWDVAGAIAAGCDAVFVNRQGQFYSPAFPQPTLIAPDVTEAAGRIVEHYG